MQSALGPVALACLVAFGCGGSQERSDPPVAPLAPRADDELQPGSRSTTCRAALDRVEVLVGGDLSAALAAGPIAGWEALTTREKWFAACERSSPWVRRCLFLSTARDQIESCQPGFEPWSRSHEYGAPPEEKRAFNDCVNRAPDREALARCHY